MEHMRHPDEREVCFVIFCSFVCFLHVNVSIWLAVLSSVFKLLNVSTHGLGLTLSHLYL